MANQRDFNVRVIIDSKGNVSIPFAMELGPEKLEPAPRGDGLIRLRSWRRANRRNLLRVLRDTNWPSLLK